MAARRHPLALLALLSTAAAGRMSRGKIAGLLWPDAPEKTARNRLTSCVYQLRNELGRSAVLSDGHALWLNGDQVRCDVADFASATAAGEHARAVELYRGPFLDGFWIRNSPDFDQWVDAERARLQREYRRATEALAAQAAEAARWTDAAGWWRQALGEDPFDARLTMALMTALVEAGNRAEALRIADRHAQLLREELGLRPDAEVCALVDQLEADPPTRLESADARVLSPPAEQASAADPLLPRLVAVLPFDNLSGSPDAEPFAAGLHDDLLTELSRMSTLNVIARTSVLRYRDPRKGISEIARELGVGTVIEGSVQTAGGRLRLHVRLIDGRSGVHRWAERYDRTLSMKTLFELQSELAGNIATAVQGEIGVTE